MLKGSYPLDFFESTPTPFYYYDMELLARTLVELKEQSARYDFAVHYAVKANFNPRILSTIAAAGLGADCVSGGELQVARDNGFAPNRMVYAGVGKRDDEIALGLDMKISFFNVESIEELRVINEIAQSKESVANIAIRVNPEVDAHTHSKITTGVRGNKFGVDINQIDEMLDELPQLTSVNVCGVHFHIGSQITDMEVFKSLAIKANSIVEMFTCRGVKITDVNFGGGLGVDYFHPNHLGIADFKSYFAIFDKYFERTQAQQIHFELGRSIVAQCGNLVARTIYVKRTTTQQFVILDAGFTELIRPAMYDSYHRIENISSDGDEQQYDVVGPLCESSDVFATDYTLDRVSRGDIIVLRSAGAYGESMSSQYNSRRLPLAYFG